jgi:hypothetical protein
MIELSEAKIADALLVNHMLRKVNKENKLFDIPWEQ